MFGRYGYCQDIWGEENGGNLRGMRRVSEIEDSGPMSNDKGQGVPPHRRRELSILCGCIQHPSLTPWLITHRHRIYRENYLILLLSSSVIIPVPYSLNRNPWVIWMALVAPS